MNDARPTSGRTVAPSVEQANGLALTVPAALVDAIAHRTAELLADRLPEPAPDPYLTVEDAAAYLSAPASRVYDLVSLRRVRHFRDGRRLLFRRSDLDAALDVEEAR